MKTYPIETVVAEKLETLLSRGTANTRMRDYYDLFILQEETFDGVVLAKAFGNTAKRRGSSVSLNSAGTLLREIEDNPEMRRLWSAYQRKFDYAAGIQWEAVGTAVRGWMEKAH